MTSFEILPEDKTHAPFYLGVEFANTLSSRGSDQPGEHLTRYLDLISWAEKVGLIDRDELHSLSEYSLQNPDEGKQTLQRAIALREALYRLVETAKAKTSPQPDDLETLNRELAIASSHSSLSFHKDHFEWKWEKQANELDQILWPLARAAVALLDSATLQRVGICEDETCRWLFYDTSKNHSRRWCDMDDCGNRAKARRHYARNKVTADPDAK